MEDLQRTLALTGLTISTTPEKGRCLISTRNFLPGEVIITQEPYVCVPNNSSEPKCDGCFKSGNLKKCSACQVPWYCGSTCQKSEWKLHRLECQAIAGLSKERRKSLTPSLRLMVRLYLKRKLQNDRVLQTTAMDNYNLVEALVDHMSDIEEKQLVLYAQMANLVNLILAWPESNIKEIAQNFSKLACNAHTICDGELRPLGTGLYPVISIINHSCSPNAILVFERQRAVIRAVEVIPQGTEVFISYIETAESTTTRQKALKEQYFFTCSCPSCRKGIYMEVQESAILEGYRCKADKCTGFLLRDPDDEGFVCQTCGLVRSKEEILNISTDVKQMEDKASKFLSSGNYLEASVMYRNVEQLQLKLCHPFSINLMRTKESLLKILMELEDWKGALTYCRYVLPAYQRVYPEIHPLVGLQYYTCGKLECASVLLKTTPGKLSTKQIWFICITSPASSGLTYRLTNVCYVVSDISCVERYYSHLVI
ncbi:hypothetical protein MKW94_030066 [Papaver nudicaule]|uniref:Histone-lysine N-methyltransferase ASHR1 n=1 Tax=Papaver nudicaule TaxID=74823 RepID=A0AA42AZ73_PAPNU|nr:hypothetical protein [Papaver nudicaule]